MSSLKIAAVCPTYKRPDLLSNALACFQHQWHQNRKLFILDDCPQFHPQWEHDFNIYTTSERYPNLPDKYNALINLAILDYKPDVIAIWEDDDVFLPWHLSQIADAVEHGHQFYRTEKVYSNYGMNKQGVQAEGAAGRFHSHWAFTVDLLNKMKNYPKTEELNFDQQLGGLAAQLDPRPLDPAIYAPSYVYRWGNEGSYHGSAFGLEGYKAGYKSLEDMPFTWIGRLCPRFDEETKRLMKIQKWDFCGG